MQKQLAVILGVILAAAAATAGVTAALISDKNHLSTEDKMLSFANYDELAQFLDSKGAGNDSGSYRGVAGGGLDSGERMSYGGGSPDYSKTNVRTEGIDEEDTVKTDGTYIYSAQWDSVRVIKAYPPSELSVVSYINSSDLISILNGTDLAPSEGRYRLSVSISGILITPGKLMVIASMYQWYDYYYDDGGYVAPGGDSTNTTAARSSYMIWTPDMQKVVVFIFDVDDPSNPEYDTLYAQTGYLTATRLQNEFLYIISQTYVWKGEDSAYLLPKVMAEGATTVLEANGILYDPGIKDPSYYLTITAIKIGSGDIKTIAILGDWSSMIYKSMESLYITFPKWNYEAFNGLIPYGNETVPESFVTTTIYRVDVDGLQMHVAARGDVKGILNDQFSIDENDRFLRLAVNNGAWGWGWGTERKNAVYVLDSDLALVGSLEGLAPNETIQAARFVGDTLYLVTFRQIDPLFVIDLSDPTNPKVMAELTLPGFSSYLHPVDEDHILGIGRENSSVKISLYDVSDQSAPKEVDKYLIDGYSYSSAQWDYKAVLFSAEKGLLVIPVSTYHYNETSYSYTDGFFVFSVSVHSGIALQGTIEHDGYYSYGGRALYIGDYLYTITDGSLKVNKISNLSEVASIELPSWQNGYLYYAVRTAALAG